MEKQHGSKSMLTSAVNLFRPHFPVWLISFVLVQIRWLHRKLYLWIRVNFFQAELLFSPGKTHEVREVLISFSIQQILVSLEYNTETLNTNVNVSLHLREWCHLWNSRVFLHTSIYPQSPLCMFFSLCRKCSLNSIGKPITYLSGGIQSTVIL